MKLTGLVTISRSLRQCRSGKSQKLESAIDPSAQRGCRPCTADVKMVRRTLELVGAPGVPISHTSSAAAAERTCQSIQARLPTAEEYEFMSNLGDWSQGVRTVERVWALANKMVPPPDLPNPSPIRPESEVRATELYCYCVR